MGEVSKALGQSTTQVFRGKTYTVAPFTYEMQCQFEQWLERRAWEAAKRTQTFLGPKDHQERMDAVNRDIAAGQYAFGSKACADAASSLPGQKQLLYLSLAPNHPDIERSTIDAMFEEQLAEFQAAMDKVNNDPNGLTPAPPGTT